MKQTAKRILAFVSVVCIALIGVFTMPFVQVNAETTTKTAELSIIANTGDLANKVITWTSGDVTFANAQDSSTNAIRTSDADHYRVYAKSKVTISTTAGTISQVVITCTSGDYATVCKTSIENADKTATVSGSAVTVTNVEAAELTFTASAQWRLNKVEVKYEAEADDPTVAAIKEELNSVEAYMSMGYKYNKETHWEDAPATEDVTDVLNNTFTGVSGTSYSSWLDKKSNSSAVYAGQSAGGNNSIQLRSNNSNSGIVTTTSGGTAKKVTLVWNSSTADGRTVNVYGSNTAFTSVTELYNNNATIGTIVCGTSTELEITDEYKYIGLRSASGALYLDEIEITWETESNATDGQVEVVTLSDSDFRIKCGVDASLDLSDINGVEYGIYVSAANGKDKYYASNSEFLQTDEEAEKKYIIISLGDIVNDVTKLTTEFTVCAYAKYNDKIYNSSTKTYSVASMIEAYYDQGVEEVEVLYDYFNKNGAI